MAQEPCGSVIDTRTIGRFFGHRRGRGVHHHHGHLGLTGQRRGREGVGREVEPGEDVHLVVHQQLLRHALGHLRRHAGVVLDDELDLAPGHGVAVLRHIDVDAMLDLLAVVGERTGHRQHKADGQVLGLHQPGAGERAGHQRGSNHGFDESHGSLLWLKW